MGGEPRGPGGVRRARAREEAAMIEVGQVAPVVEAIKPHLAGRPPAIQGAALADLLAIWLAGHPAEVREALLAEHISTVRELVPINAAILTVEEDWRRR